MKQRVIPLEDSYALSAMMRKHLTRRISNACSILKVLTANTIKFDEYGFESSCSVPKLPCR